MNKTWAVEQLEVFIRLTESRNGSGGGILTLTSYSTSPRKEVLQQWATVQKILELVHSHWRNEERQDPHYEFGQQRDAAIHAKALIEKDNEIQEFLKPEGPTLSSDNLHGDIWGPAGHLWGDGHFRSALQAASMALDVKMQNFVKRLDVSGSDLVNQAFSDNLPEVGKPRIRVPEQNNKETTRSLQQGMRSLGQACFSITRNLSSHAPADISEQVGLEQLAMLSLFARILDTCTVDSIDG